MHDAQIKEFGRAASAEFDQTSPEELMEGQQRFLDSIEAFQQKTQDFYRTLVWVAAAVLLGGIGAAAFLVGRSTPSQLPRAKDSIAHRVTQSGDKEIITFDGGSIFVLDGSADAKVVRSSYDEVVVALHKGDVQCDISGNNHTRWMVRADHYQVLVTGTRFSVHWQPKTRIFKVDVSEGTVLVTGKQLPTHGIQLTAAEKLTVVGNHVMLNEQMDAAQTDVPANLHSLHPPTNRSTSNDTALVKRSVSKRTADKESRPLTDETLWQRGNQARYNGQYDEAYKRFNTLYRRFPQSPYAQQSVFLLGRISLDSQNNPSQAKYWFERYLKISPNGKLAQQSMGRLIRICRDKAQLCASQYAKVYLKRFPNGPFAELAHSVLE